MEIQILLWGTLALPILLGVFFRAAGPHLFFALMAGELLGRYFGHDVAGVAANPAAERLGAASGEIFLTIVPVVLTAFFMRHSVKKSRLILHLIPYAITGVVLATFIFPLLPMDIQSSLETTFVGGWILHLHRSIIGVVIGAQLIALWLFNLDEKGHRR